MAFTDEEVAARRQVDLHDPEMQMQFCPRPAWTSPPWLPWQCMPAGKRRASALSFLRSEFSENTHRTGKSSTFSGHADARPWKTRGYHPDPAQVTATLYQVWPNSSAKKDNGKTTGTVRASCSTLPRSHLSLLRMNLPVCGIGHSLRTLTSLRLCACSNLQLPLCCLPDPGTVSRAFKAHHHTRTFRYTNPYPLFFTLYIQDIYICKFYHSVVKVLSLVLEKYFHFPTKVF